MDVKGQETVCTVPISLIDDFAEHPFQVRDDEDMERLVQSIDNNGVLNPVIAVALITSRERSSQL